MFTPPRTGWYNICAYMRFKNSGNANDIVLYKVRYKRITTKATEKLFEDNSAKSDGNIL
jgi:hypothetical protein